jgi:ribosomal protein S18 acetylase RimI-like enzyme
VNVRRATEADEATLRELWEEFEREVPEPFGEPETWEEEWADTLDDIRGGGVFLAEDEQGAVGVARIEAPAHGRTHLPLLHVRPRARRAGVAKALLAECLRDARERGAEHVTLEVLTTNEAARTVWSRLGFEPYALLAVAPLDRLEQRLAPAPVGEHRGSIHVQSDDRASVERAVAAFVPRLEAPDVRPSASWIRVADPLLDRDHDAQARLARELGERLGAVVVALSLEGEVVRFRLYESARMVDEYLSVPTYYGPLSKGDELALEANPTLVSRLTGADRDAVRHVARTASSPAELPPAAELYEQLAGLMGLDG